MLLRFMKEYLLSQIFSNHSIGVTLITVLIRQELIMAVSGHKSVQSLAHYQQNEHFTETEMENL